MQKKIPHNFPMKHKKRLEKKTIDDAERRTTTRTYVGQEMRILSTHSAIRKQSIIFK